MDRDQAIALLRAHEPELRAAGVASLSVFGSVARSQATVGSDVDVVVMLGRAAPRTGFAYFGRVDELVQRFQEILGSADRCRCRAGAKERLRREIEREAAPAF